MFWNIVLAVGSFILQLLLLPKPQDAEQLGLEDIEAPTAEEGISLPVLFGTRLLKGPNVTWYGDFKAEPVLGPRRYLFFGPRQILGYRYFLGIQMTLCHGPADYLTEIIVGEDKELWKGNSTGGSISVNKPELLGENQGGIVGTVNVDMGEPDQLQNSYLVSVLGDGVPAYRGSVNIILNQVELGKSTYIQPWSFYLQRIYKTSEGEDQWYSEKAAIGDSVTFESDLNATPPGMGSFFLSSQDMYGGYLVRPITGGARAYKFPDYDTPVWETTGYRTSGQACCIGDETGTVFVAHRNTAHVSMFDLVTGNFKGELALSSGGLTNCTISSITINGICYVFVHRGGSLYLLRHTGGSNLVEIDFTSASYSYITTCQQFALSPSRVYMKKGGSLHSSDKVIRIIDWSPSGFGSFNDVTLSDVYGTSIRFITYHPELDRVFVHDNGGGIHAYTPDLSTKLYSSNEAGGALNTFMIGARRAIDQYGRIVFMTARTGAQRYIVAFHPGDLSISFDLSISAIYGVGTVNSAYASSGVDPTEDYIAVAGSSGIALLKVLDFPLFKAGLDMNPAHIIRECLTDKNWGMGYNDSDMDDVSFVYAADYLWNEGFGLSLLWSREDEIQNFITSIISHIDAYLFVSRRTGKFKLKLIRDDYDINNLPIFDEDDVVSWEEVARRQPAEAVNSIIVKYWSREKRKDASHSIHNIAQIQQLGNMISNTRQYPGITKSDLAVRVGTRDLKSLGIGFISGRLEGKRSFEDLEPGEPFRLVSSDHELTGQVMRLVDARFGDGKENRIPLKFTEDIFNLGDDVLVDESSYDWENPHNPPQPVVVQYAKELTYYELVKFLGLANVNAELTSSPTLGFFKVAAPSPATGTINAVLYVDPDTGTYTTTERYIQFCPIATLNEDVGFSDISFTLRDAASLSSVRIGSLAVIGDEIVRVDSIVGLTITIGRGCLDTVPSAHSEGDYIIFYEDFSDSDYETYQDDQDVGVRLLTRTGFGILSLFSSLESRIVFDSRAIRPLRPADVRVETDPLGPVVATSVTEIEVTWVNRNRLTETSPLDWVDPTVTPETGQTTTIDVIALDGVTVLDNITGLTGTSHMVNVSSFGTENAGIVRVYSERDGYRSLNHHDIIVYVSDETGYGYDYGYNYGGA